MLAALIEVSVFQDIGKNSEEILNYLRIIIIAEPVSCLHNVQQVLFYLFIHCFSHILFIHIIISFSY